LGQAAIRSWNANCIQAARIGKSGSLFILSPHPLAVFSLAALTAAHTGAQGPIPNSPPWIITGNFSVGWIQHSPVGAAPEVDFKGDPVLPVEAWRG